MKKIDKDGFLLCELQAKAFELSRSEQNSSSDIFIRRFMNSEVAKEIDSLAILGTNLQAKDLLDRINEEYGISDYGSVKYSPNELYWIGYLYRYYIYTYEKTSVQAYKMVKPKELKGLYLAYHTMDPRQAIERILEAKQLSSFVLNEEVRQYEIYKKIRGDISV